VRIFGALSYLDWPLPSHAFLVRLGGRWPVTAVLVLVAAFTLCPLPPWDGARLHFFSIVPQAGVSAWVDFGENVMLYLPIGIVLQARWRRAFRTCGTGAVLSLVLELIQFVVPGRDPSLSDVLANTVGALLGTQLFRTASDHAHRQICVNTPRSTVDLA
jgi:VanZ family protein